MDAKLQERIEPGTNILYIYSENDLGFMQMKKKHRSSTNKKHKGLHGSTMCLCPAVRSCFHCLLKKVGLQSFFGVFLSPHLDYLILIWNPKLRISMVSKEYNKYP